MQKKGKGKMIKFEDIVNANKTIQTTDIKGKEYAEVNQRVKAFRMLYPNGAITTDIVSLKDGIVVIKATAQDEEGKTLATGYAYEKENSTFINKTSFIENCETSAVGRALGMCGIGIDVSIASYEEVANAVENQKKEAPNKSTVKGASTSNYTVDYRKKLIEYCQSQKVDMKEIAKAYGINGATTQERFKEVLKELGVD